MANTAVINAIGISSYAFVPLEKGETAFERVLAFARGLPEVEDIHIFTDSDEVSRAVSRAPSTRIAIHLDTTQKKWSVKLLFDELVRLGEEHEDLFYFYADCPLLDSRIADRMYANHRLYFSEYTFADGYPLGMSPEIVRVEALPQMRRLVDDSDGAIQRDTVFTVIQRDINGFDIETEISPADVRLLRVQLYCDNLRNFRITSRIVAAGGHDEESVLSVVQRQQELLRSVPAYFEVQITETMNQVPAYLPYRELGAVPGKRGREMGLADFRGLVEQISGFSETAVVNLSLACEPAAHPEIAAFAGAILEQPGLEALIETSAVGWRDKDLESLARLPHERITWIVDLDASTKELYESLRGAGWDEAQATCNRIIELFPGRVHVQAVRMQENEADLEAFYRYWKERVPNVIIQKYDWYSGFLPQKKVTDLSPLKRLPCWHIKRDMIVLVDGSVPLCREDLKREHVLGNVWEEPVAEIWSKGEPYHVRHVNEDYPEICKGCDEYYTYNF